MEGKKADAGRSLVKNPARVGLLVDKFPAMKRVTLQLVFPRQYFIFYRAGLQMQACPGPRLAYPTVAATCQILMTGNTPAISKTTQITKSTPKIPLGP